MGGVGKGPSVGSDYGPWMGVKGGKTKAEKEKARLEKEREKEKKKKKEKKQKQIETRRKAYDALKSVLMLDIVDKSENSKVHCLFIIISSVIRLFMSFYILHVFLHFSSFPFILVLS